MTAGASSTTTVVGERVETVRAGQQEDLEALLSGDLLEQLEGPLGTLVIERDEGIVEDEGRPAVHRHEAHEAESSGQEELVGGALRELPDVDELPVSGCSHA